MRSSRWWDVAAVFLLIGLLVTAAARLMATEWVAHLGLVQTVLFLGLVAGLALGYSIFHPALAAGFATLYGLFVVPWQLILNVSYVAEDVLWSDRLIVLVNRLTHSFQLFVYQRPVRDPALFLFAMASLTWLLSVYVGYSLTRRAEPWRIILPPGAGILLIHTSDMYRDRGLWYLVAYLLLALLLLARLTYLQLRRQWEEEGARIPPLAGLDISYAVVAAAVLVILLAWTVPSMAGALPAARRAWDQATAPWEQRFNDLFASLERLGPPRPARYYGGELALGSGSELSDALVAAVQVPEESGPYQRHYWRARVYDHYADGRWSATAFPSTETFQPTAADYPLPELEGRETVTFTFTSYEPVATLLVGPQPLWASRAVEVNLAHNADGTVDVAALRATPFLEAGETYAVRSSVTAATMAELRATGTDYPEWVTDRYLQVPESITARTEELARQIAGDYENPYDAVAAVTRYLRHNIQYSQTMLESAPRDQEVLDWFLFDYQTGFCNYYASSQVVLLRVLGIPARLAVGFGAGERQPGTNTHLVAERNAHAWPEVYFPGLGWVEFEPTASEDPISRPRGEIGPDDDDRDRIPPGGGPDDLWPEGLEMMNGYLDMPVGDTVPLGPPTLVARIRSSYRLIAAAAAAILMVAFWRWRRRRSLPPFAVLLERAVRNLGWTPPVYVRRWAHRARLSPLEKAYIELDRALLRLGAPPGSADTPAERAADLGAILPEASQAVIRLALAYQGATYGPHRRSVYQAQEAARDIRWLSWEAKLRRAVGLG